jgi:hypothetical protein
MVSGRPMRRSNASSIGAAGVGVLFACLIGLHASRASAAGPPFLVAADFTIDGSGRNLLTDLVVDASGNAYVSGVVGSYNFPGIKSATVTNAGNNLRFVAKIPPLSRTPAFVAVVGSPLFGEDEVTGLAIDAGGNAYLVAYESSKDYPVAGGAYSPSTGSKYVYKVSATGAVAKLSPALDPAIKRVAAIALDSAGAIYLTGSAHDGLQTTAAAPYPTSSVAANCIAPYMMKLDPAGQTVLYATYLGNSGTQGQICGGAVKQLNIDAINIHPTGFAVAIDGAGYAYVTGQAEPGLPATAGSPDYGTKVVGLTGFNNLIIDPASHAFVSKINPAGTAIVYTARLGGTLRDRGTSIVLDPSGAAIVAGKTSSPNFPSFANAALGGLPFVGMDCLLWTPEFGFLAKLSPDGRQIVFSGYLPLDGAQLDDCEGSGALNPAKVTLDTGGNIYVAGFTTASNRQFHATPGAIIPEPNGYQTPIGNQLFQVFSSDGQRKLYSTALPRYGAQGIAIDPWQNVIIANDNGLQRLSPGALPVDVVAGASPLCAGQPSSLIARVAASNDLGLVDIQIDGASIGSSTIVNGNATKTTTLAVGIRKGRATYHGPGPFDGYSSPDVYFAVNQAGSCP